MVEQESPEQVTSTPQKPPTNLEAQPKRNFLREALDRFKRKEKSVKPAENKEEQNKDFHPPAYEHTIRKISAEAPEILADTTKILKAVDRQGPDNFQVFTPDKFPGVQIPYVKISVNQVAEEVFGIKTKPPIKESTLQSDKDTSFVVFPSFLPPPDGHPYFAWNVAYERVIQYLPKIASAAKTGERIPDINIIIAGNAYNELGSVTKDWVKAVAKEGFSLYGRTYADLASQAEPNLKDRRVILFGPSMGASIASQVSKNLPDTDTQLYLENPAGLYRKLAKRIQAPIGFAAEGIATMISSKEGRRDFQELHSFTQKAKQMLTEKGKLPQADKNGNLKYAAALVDVGNLIKGTQLDTENVRSYVYRGIFDPTATDKTFFIENFAKATAVIRNTIAQRSPRLISRLLETTPIITGKIRSEGKSIKFPVTSTHGMERIRVNKWRNIINYCRSSQQQPD